MRSTQSRLAAFAASLFFAPAVFAGGASADTPKPKLQPAAHASASAPAQPGMRAYIDPQTGKLVDHPVTAQQQRAATQVDTTSKAAGVREVRHLDGSIETILNGAADVDMVATLDKDGKIHVQCNDAKHEHAAAAAVASQEAGNER